MRGAAVAVIAVLALAGCASVQAPETAPAPAVAESASPDASAEAPAGDLAIACTAFPEAYLDLQTMAIESDNFAEIAVQSGLARLALEAAAESTLGDASFESFIAEQLAFLETVDAAALAEDRVALLKAVQEGPSFVEPLADTCEGQPG